ncbi:MAG: PAS domain-containing protein [Mucilaginibacter polytrichastri]|nr:PAS domain-containing protein [Mucilaginibacter polytrichastri]
MAFYPIPENEHERIRELLGYQVLDTAFEKDYDDLTRLASIICGTSIALISLIDEQRQWFKSRYGISISETPRDYSFCAYAIVSNGDLMVVENAKDDPRFAANPMVTGETGITFYAGVPLINENGFALGTLCVVDQQQKKLTDEQVRALRIIARQVMDKLELRRKVTELEKTNRLLRESRQQVETLNQVLVETQSRLQLLIEQATVAIIIFKGKNLVIEAANAAMLNLLNKDQHIIGKPLLEAIPELTGQEPYKLLYKVYTTGEPITGYDTPVTLLRNGRTETGYFNFSYTPLIENGEITGVIDTANEVTPQFLARKQIEETEQLLQFALRSAEIGTWQVGMTGEGLILSDLASAILDIAPGQDLTALSVMDMLDETVRNRVRKSVMQAVEQGKDFIEEIPVQLHEGTRPKWLRVSGKLRYKNDGSSGNITGTVQDITERKELEQRKDDFISIASHELKTPITSLKGTIQLLERLKNKPDSPLVPKLIDQSVLSVEKIHELVNDLLNATRLNEGQIELHCAFFTLKNMLQHCADQMSRTGDLRIHVDCDEQIRIFADENRLEQVMINLLNNAAKYAPESPLITISAKATNKQIRVSVRDQGKGIQPEKLPHLFERYYRSDHSGVHYFGLGLGLYICSEIIKKHGGIIGAESQPGEGSTFWFTLPKAD